MLGPKNNADLKSISDFNSDWARRIAYLILAGLLVDVADLFIPEGWWKITVAIAANLLIFGGVWGELWFAERARAADDGRVAEAEKAVAESNVRALEAKERTAAAEVQLERLRQQGRQIAAPRIPKLEPFMEEIAKASPSMAEVLYDSNVSDAFFLATMIRGMLGNAGWEMRPNKIPGVTPILPQSLVVDPPPPGLPIFFSVPGRISPEGIAIIASRPKRDPDDPTDSRNALAQAIFKSGAERKLSFGTDPQLPDNELRIVVGHKALSWIEAPASTDADNTSNDPQNTNTKMDLSM
jgi:hypothetical protein